jgi:hypothetical protein
VGTRIDEINNPDSVLNRAADDEPLFILRSRDILAVPLVNIWISNAALLEAFGKLHKIETIPDEKVTSAIRVRDMMMSWQATHHDKIKLPD